MPFLQPDLGDQFAQPGAQGRAGQACQPGERLADQPPHRVPPVQRGIRILEHDLQRFQLLQGPLSRGRRQRRVTEGHHRAWVRRDQPEQHPGQGGLTAPALTDDPERLAGDHVQADV